MQGERSRECQVAREMQGILAGMSSAAAVAEKGAEMRHTVEERQADYRMEEEVG